MDIEYIFIAIVIVVALVLLYLGFVHLIKNKRLIRSFNLPFQFKNCLRHLVDHKILKKSVIRLLRLQLSWVISNLLISIKLNL